MNIIKTTTRALGLAALLGAAAGCQDMNTFLTGEKFSRAPDGSPRVEAELAVQIDDSFVGSFASVGQAVELGDATSDMVLSLADIGTRFYPVPSEEYASKDVRPRYVMSIQIEDLDFEFGSETTEETEGEPVTRFFVTGVSCVATATVEKRRKHAPPLVVGQGAGDGQVRVRGTVESSDAGDTYEVRRRANDGQVVLVRREDVLDAAEKAVIDAMRGVVRAVDREFSPENATGE